MKKLIPIKNTKSFKEKQILCIQSINTYCT